MRGRKTDERAIIAPIVFQPNDAIRAADFVGAKTIVGVHYDTFPPIKLDHEVALNRFRAAGKELLLPKIGETIEI